jgi:ATP synthase protein I
MADKEDRRAFFKDLGKFSALGFEMAIAVIIGLVIGSFLDKRLGTGPWLTIVWLGLGFAAGVRSLYRAAVRSGRDLPKDDEGKGKPGGR